MSQVLVDKYLMSMFDAVEYSGYDVFTPDLTGTLGAAAAHNLLLLKHDWNVYLGSCLRVSLVMWRYRHCYHETWHHTPPSASVTSLSSPSLSLSSSSISTVKNTLACSQHQTQRLQHFGPLWISDLSEISNITDLSFIMAATTSLTQWYHSLPPSSARQTFHGS